MSTYCTSTQVAYYLPSGHGITDYTAYIAWGSSYVDSALQPIYYALPAVTGTPATPALVQDIAARLSAWYIWQKLGVSNRFSDTSSSAALRASAVEDLEKLKTDPPMLVLPLETVSGEVIDAWGTAPLEANEYKLDSTYTVIPETATISGFEYGVDFFVGYSTAVRGWVLTRVDSTIYSTEEVGESLDATVTYQYSYRKRVELDEPVTRTAKRIVRGG